MITVKEIKLLLLSKVKFSAWRVGKYKFTGDQFSFYCLLEGLRRKINAVVWNSFNCLSLKK